MINFAYILERILPTLVVSSIVSLFVGVIGGGVVGLIIGAIARRREKTLYAAIVGSFGGTLLLGMLPLQLLLLSYPNGLGPYGPIVIMPFLVLVLPAAAIVGGIVGAVCGLRLAEHLKARVTGISLAIIYVVMAISLYIQTAPAALQFVQNPPQHQEILPLAGKITGYDDFFCCMAFSPDGHKFVAASSSEIRVWDLATGKLRSTFKGKSSHRSTPADQLQSIAISPDGTTMGVAAYESITLRDLATGKILQKFDGNDLVFFSHDGKSLFGIKGKSGGPSLRIWDGATGQLRYTIPTDQNLLATGTIPFALSADGKTLALAPVVDSDRLEGWDLATGKAIYAFEGQRRDRITALALTPDGKTLISAHLSPTSMTLKFWSLPNGKLIKTIPDVGEVKALAVTPNGKTLISHGDRLTLWQLPDGKRRQSWENPLQRLASDVVLSPDGKLLAGYGSKVIKLWRLPE